MSFGKKGQTQTEKFQKEFKVTPTKTYSATSSSGGLGAIVTGIAGIAILSSTVFMATIYFGSTQSSTASVNSYFADEPTPIARSYEKNLLRSSSIFGAASGGLKIKIPRTETGLNAIDSELHERCLKPHFPNEAHDMMRLGYVSFSARKSVKFLACTASIFKSRFCDSHYRARFAERLTDTIKSHHKMEARMAKLAKSKGMQGYIYRQAKAHKSLNDSSANNGIIGGDNQGPIISAEMSSQLAELSKYGLISKSDFSSMFKEGPKEVMAHLKPQQYKVCPSSWF